jgi:hypothetical protein
VFGRGLPATSCGSCAGWGRCLTRERGGCARDAACGDSSYGMVVGHHVAIKRRRARTYNYLVVGEITLDWDTFTYDTDPDQQLIVSTAEPGSPSERNPAPVACSVVTLRQHANENRCDPVSVRRRAKRSAPTWRSATRAREMTWSETSSAQAW